jgi:hypothetical protein
MPLLAAASEDRAHDADHRDQAAFVRLVRLVICTWP